MSDEPAPEESEGAAAPKAPAVRGTRGTGKRLSTTGGLAVGPSAEEQRRFRRRLLLGIIVAVGVLLAANVYFWVIRPMFAKKGHSVDPAKESEAAFEGAKDARHKIEKIERKVYEDGGTLETADYSEIKAQLSTIMDSVGVLMNLLDLIRHQKDGESSKEYHDIVLMQFQAKVWLNDAGEVVDSEKDKTAQPGFYIPMELAMRKWKKAHEDFENIVKNQDELKKDPEQKKKCREQLEALAKAISESRDTFTALDDLVQKWLATEVSAREVSELGPLREEGTLANQALTTMRQTRDEFKD